MPDISKETLDEVDLALKATCAHMEMCVGSLDASGGRSEFHPCRCINCRALARLRAEREVK